MRTAELIAPYQFRLVDQEIDAPAAGEVQVRVDAVGICGSDLHSYSEGAVGDTAAVYPMVLGHEPAGTVVRVGAGVTGWQRIHDSDPRRPSWLPDRADGPAVP